MENLVILVGHLGADPELRHTNGGVPVANFDMATTDKWADKTNGEKREHTEWHRVEVWKNLGKACADNLKKGSKVYVRGALRNKSWETDQGEKRSTKVIRAERIKFL